MSMDEAGTIIAIGSLIAGLTTTGIAVAGALESPEGGQEDQAAILDAARRERQRIANSRGRGETVLGGGIEGRTRKKTLLGE